MRIGHWLIWLGLGSACALTQASPARAQARATPTFFVDTQFGLTTAKSPMLLSNDTGTTLRYGFGAFAGHDSELGFQIMVDSENTTFALNSSSMQTQWQDTLVRYFYGPAYFGVLFSQAQLKVKNQGVDTIDASGSGYGGAIGVLFEIGRSGSLHFDVNTVSIPTMKNSLPLATSITQRLDLDLGASIDLTSKLLDFTFGYRTRSTSITTDKAYSETSSSTYAGLRLSLYF